MPQTRLVLENQSNRSLGNQVVANVSPGVLPTDGANVAQVEAATDKNFGYSLSAVTSTTISHNLNKYPAVTLVDASGQEYIVTPIYNSLNAATVNFPTPFTGTLYFN
jgi:glycine cleavage system aminomethyltransferase T